MSHHILQQLKRRRIQLGIKQHDMLLRVGIFRQQYQRLESTGNPRLDTLELIAKGLNSQFMLIPNEQLDAVQAAIANSIFEQSCKQFQDEKKKDVSEDPWQGLLDND